MGNLRWIIYESCDNEKDEKIVMEFSFLKICCTVQEVENLKNESGNLSQNKACLMPGKRYNTANRHLVINEEAFSKISTQL